MLSESRCHPAGLTIHLWKTGCFRLPFSPTTRSHFANASRWPVSYFPPKWKCLRDFWQCVCYQGDALRCSQQAAGTSLAVRGCRGGVRHAVIPTALPIRQRCCSSGQGWGADAPAGSEHLTLLPTLLPAAGEHLLGIFRISLIVFSVRMLVPESLGLQCFSYSAGYPARLRAAEVNHPCCSRKAPWYFKKSSLLLA